MLVRAGDGEIREVVASYSRSSTPGRVPRTDPKLSRRDFSSDRRYGQRASLSHATDLVAEMALMDLFDGESVVADPASEEGEERDGGLFHRHLRGGQEFWWDVGRQIEGPRADELQRECLGEVRRRDEPVRRGAVEACELVQPEQRAKSGWLEAGREAFDEQDGVLRVARRVEQAHRLGDARHRPKLHVFFRGFVDDPHRVHRARGFVPEGRIRQPRAAAASVRRAFDREGPGQARASVEKR
jgi:hypothetical protein